MDVDPLRMESLTYYSVLHRVILCSYLTQTQSSAKLHHLVQIQGRLLSLVNVNMTPVQRCAVTMTTGHFTATAHSGMLWSDSDDLELLVVDRWTR